MTTTNESSKPADGGPAFPVNTQRFEDGSINVYPEPGMTLRDYFAAKAMQAFLGLYPEFDHVVEEVSADAYQMADAMLKARG
ncbi:hypothetical protein [Burkholderia gladioli]|uniref:hypothetical protein n=1 Tax=Burkholderia gladioli TaxID=28095 RepID=UPI00163E0466|nr:hypothetical protein [Burkholderia gladioli]